MNGVIRGLPDTTSNFLTPSQQIHEKPLSQSPSLRHFCTLYLADIAYESLIPCSLPAYSLEFGRYVYWSCAFQVPKICSVSPQLFQLPHLRLSIKSERTDGGPSSTKIEACTSKITAPAGRELCCCCEALCRTILHSAIISVKFQCSALYALLLVITSSL